jgi:small subunit ribosomal protein S12
MGKKTNGINAATKLEKRRETSRWLSKKYVSKTLNLKKMADPLEGASQAKGIILEKVQIEAKQPNSAMRKAAKVQLKKNGKKITAFLPWDGAMKMVDEHDEVVVECIGGKMGRAKGDLPSIRWQVIKVNDQSLQALLTGKVEKARK